MKNIFCLDCQEQIEKEVTCHSGKIICDSCHARLSVLSGGLSTCHHAVVFLWNGNRVCGHCLNNCSLIPMQRIAA